MTATLAIVAGLVIAGAAYVTGWHRGWDARAKRLQQNFAALVARGQGPGASEDNRGDPPGPTIRR